MTVEKRNLWQDDRQSSYTMYLLDNISEIEPDRRHPAIVICGGGGYLRITRREQEPLAMYFLNQEYQVFVLNYSTKGSGGGVYPEPVYDLAKMVALIRENAAEWNIDPNAVAILGFSAGGHLCASLATQWHEPYLEEALGVPSQQLRPNAVVLGYPMLDCSQSVKPGSNSDNVYSPVVGMKRADYQAVSFAACVGKFAQEKECREASPMYHVTEQVPPTFLWHTARDELVPMGQALRFAGLLAEVQVPVELHIFERGPHGMALADRRTASVPELMDEDVAVWIELAIRFLKRHLKRSAEQ